MSNVTIDYYFIINTGDLALASGDQVNVTVNGTSADLVCVNASSTIVTVNFNDASNSTLVDGLDANTSIKCTFTKSVSEADADAGEMPGLEVNATYTCQSCSASQVLLGRDPLELPAVPLAVHHITGSVPSVASTSPLLTYTGTGELVFADDLLTWIVHQHSLVSLYCADSVGARHSAWSLSIKCVRLSCTYLPGLVKDFVGLP